MVILDNESRDRNILYTCTYIYICMYIYIYEQANTPKPS
jgi:hypothetical protein